MSIPAIIALFLLCTAMYIEYTHDGQKKSPEDQVYNFKRSMVGIVIWMVLLTWGGFFNPHMETFNGSSSSYRP